MGTWCTRRSINTVVRRTKRTSSLRYACCNFVCNALTVAALTWILRLTGVSSSAIVTAMSMETYTRLLMEAISEFPSHFLDIYSPDHLGHLAMHLLEGFLHGLHPREAIVTSVRRCRRELRNTQTSSAGRQAPRSMPEVWRSWSHGQSFTSVSRPGP